MSRTLIIQLTESCHPSSDPVILRFIRGDLKPQYKVGGVTSRAESPTPGTGLVRRTVVDWLGLEFANLSGFQPHNG